MTCKIFTETGEVPLACLFKCERGCVHEPYQPPCRVPDTDFAEVPTPAQLEVEAQMLYDECPTVKPTWDQLGETTKSVWRDRVLAGERARLW